MTSPSALPVALITGASRGIGRAIADELASTHHLLLGGRDRAALEALASSYPSAEPFAVDVREVSGTDVAGIDRLDVLVHSAGVLKMGAIADLEDEAWRTSFEINVFAVAKLTRLLLPALRAARGQVVAINSGSGYSSGAGSAVYSGTKFALRALTDALREEERPHGVRVSSIHPGRVATDMQAELHEFEGKDYSPTAWIQPEQVARTVRLAVDAPRDSTVESLSIRPSGMA
ncbi:NADP-dependent 3-hydroxy acid dehydrogenase YdfG [Arthrobacter subterraneus]|uniref:NADP-dependent 3-hydroxy acid dehydrogenase YdfG n=1 Tax=Arthrobacter subterraneus TaxID=335973 RepID=A0A1G8DLF2_9MICC|nr:SDR family oxidoreductase [Arthrobacter subterraneus]SDH58425.1 NADP-dependent 3-hydroxy acid dehydrogenase YdfG [Arthrobacter subterraneus]